MNKLVAAAILLVTSVRSIALPESPDRSGTRIQPDTAATPRLQAWQDLQYGMFLHFGMSTFTGNELDPGNMPSTTYAPDSPDPGQWIRVAKDAGMKYAVLTSKHVSGHCLWNSKVEFRGKEYDYDVATSGNKKDVVRAFVDACGKQGIVPGLYYCLLDFRNNNVKPEHQWGRFLLPDDFFQLAKDQLAELATNYPEVRYFWLDIPRAASPDQRSELYDLLRRKNPANIVLFNCGFFDPKKQPDITIENTMGSSWPTDVLNTERDPVAAPFSREQSWQGRMYHLGYEHCDVIGKDWFWTADDKARPVETLFHLYEAAVLKGGGNLLLDVGPDRSGKLQAWQIDALMSLKAKIDAAPDAHAR